MRSITKWALIRRNELVDVPEKFTVHKDFLSGASEQEVKKAFAEVHDLFFRLYTQMAEEPEYFSFPLQEIGEFDYFSKEEQEVRKKPWDIFFVLLAMFSTGTLNHTILIVSIAEFQKICKVKNIPVYLKILSDYGFQLQGLKNGKLPKAEESITVEYPDNNVILSLLSLVAKKVLYVQMEPETNLTAMDVVYRNAFLGWDYHIVEEGLQTISNTQEWDYVGSKLHSEEEKKTIAALHKAIVAEGYQCKLAGRNEGPCIRYYFGSAGVYDFAVNEVDGKLQLEIRLRNAEKCIPLVSKSNPRIQEMFKKSDPGCQNRKLGSCRSSVRFEFEGEERWHCGCCGAPFQIFPVQEEIPVYLQLVKLGKTKK